MKRIKTYTESKDQIYKLHKIKPRFYCEKIDEIMDSLINEKDTLMRTYSNILHLGDMIRYRWQYYYMFDAMVVKMSAYDISKKKIKDGVVIRIKRKPLKKIISEMVAKRI